MPSIGGVDVPNWCVAAGAAVLTPAAVYAYLLRQGRARQAFFADTPQPKEPGPIFAGIVELEKIQGQRPIEPVKKHFKDLGLTWGVRLPVWLFPNMEFMLFTADPAIIGEIQSKKDLFHSRPSGTGFDTTMPKGLLALRNTGPQSSWALHRRLVAPLFSDKFLEGYSSQVSEKADMLRFVLNANIQEGEVECDIQNYMKFVTLDVIGSIGFGFNSKATMTLLPEQHPKALSKAETERELSFSDAGELLLFETQRRTGEPSFAKYWPPRYMRWLSVQKVLGKRIDEVLESGTVDNSRLNMLKALQDAHEEGRKMSKAELRDEILTLLMAGHETTGYTTSWALLEVARNPEVQEKILAEASTLDLDNMQLTHVQGSLPYTWMVWQEALRLHPTVIGHVRQAEADVTLGGKYSIPRGTLLVISQLMLAHNEDTWGSDVMDFRPERMEKGYPDMYLPFGFGGRACIGKRLAYVEGVYLLAFIVKNFNLRIQEGSPAPTPKVSITQSSEDGINLLMSKRRQ